MCITLRQTTTAAHKINAQQGDGHFSKFYRYTVCTRFSMRFVHIFF